MTSYFMSVRLSLKYDSNFNRDCTIVYALLQSVCRIIEILIKMIFK